MVIVSKVIDWPRYKLKVLDSHDFGMNASHKMARESPNTMFSA